MVGYTIIIRDEKLFKRRLNFYARNEKQAIAKVRSKYPKCAILKIDSQVI